MRTLSSFYSFFRNCEWNGVKEEKGEQRFWGGSKSLRQWNWVINKIIEKAFLLKLLLCAVRVLPYDFEMKEALG